MKMETKLNLKCTKESKFKIVQKSDYYPLNTFRSDEISSNIKIPKRSSFDLFLAEAYRL